MEREGASASGQRLGAILIAVGIATVVIGAVAAAALDAVAGAIIGLAGILDIVLGTLFQRGVLRSGHDSRGETSAGEAEALREAAGDDASMADPEEIPERLADDPDYNPYARED